MKPTNPTIEARRNAAEASVAWLLRLTDGAAVWHAASREVLHEGEVWPARLAPVPEWSMRGVGPFGVGGMILSRAEVRVGDVPGSGSLRSWIASRSPLALDAELLLLWMDPGGAEPVGEATTLLRGRVTGWRTEPAAVVVTLADRVSAAWGKRVGRVLVPEMLGGESSPLAGRPLPLVFGGHAALPLEPLRTGASGKLAAPLGPADRVARLVSVAGFPPAGEAQIGEEVVSYEAFDAEAATLGTPSRPLSRGQNVALHSAGEPVRSIPVGGFQWLVADHACNAVTDVRADGLPVDGADWGATTRDLGGIGAQVVVMPRWPVRAGYERAARTRTARELLGAAAFSIPVGSTALDGPLAIDGKSTSTAARLQSGAVRLYVDVNRELGRQGPLLGMWAGAELRVRYSASKRWAAASQLFAQVVLGGDLVGDAVPRPASDAAAEGVQEFALDLAPLVGDAGWAALDAATPAQIRVFFVPILDDAVVRVHEVELRLSYLARSEAAEAARITARVEGWPDGGGGCVANPVATLLTLLTEPRFGAVPFGEIDLIGAAAALDRLEALGYRFARRVDDGPELGPLLESVAREAGIWARLGGAHATFALAGAAPPAAEAVGTLDDARALDPLAPTIAEAAEGAAVDRLTVTAARPGDGTEPAVWSRHSGAAGAEAAHPARRALRWLAGDSAGALADLGERLWAAMREPLLTHRPAAPLGACALEPGDVAVVGREAVGLAALPMWIEEARLEGPARVRLKLRAPEAGGFCWREGDAAWLRHQGFGARLALAVGGATVMEIDLAGDGRLKGRLREDAGFAAAPQGAPIVWDGAWVVFGFAEGEAHTPFLRVNAEGDAELNGAVREESSLEFAPGGPCHGAAEGRFWLAPGGAGGGFEFRADGATLHLKGRLRESATL